MRTASAGLHCWGWSRKKSFGGWSSKEIAREEVMVVPAIRLDEIRVVQNHVAVVLKALRTKRTQEGQDGFAVSVANGEICARDLPGVDPCKIVETIECAVHPGIDRSYI